MVFYSILMLVILFFHIILILPGKFIIFVRLTGFSFKKRLQFRLLNLELIGYYCTSTPLGLSNHNFLPGKLL